MRNLNRLLFCIVLISAVILGSLIQVRADVVFQDNFGSGNLNNWVVSGSPKIVSSPTFSGSKYAVQFSAKSLGNFNSTSGVVPLPSLIQGSFPQSNTATLEFYFQIDTISQNESLIGVAQILNGGETDSPTLQLFRLTNGSLAWVFSYPINETTGSLMQMISNIQKNVWYKIDITIDMSGSGEIQLSINDATVFSTTPVEISWNPYAFALGPAGLSNGYSNGNIYFDNVKVTNTANISQTTSSPAVPEFPTLVILPLLLSVFFVTVLVNIEKPITCSNDLFTRLGVPALYLRSCNPTFL